MQRIIITGANGFIGKHLTGHLLAHGHKQIIPLFRSKEIPSQLQGLQVVHGSFSDSNLTRQIIRSGDTVFHLGCSSIPASSEAAVEKDIEENIIGTVRFMQVCSEAGINRFIFISSGGTVYGRGKSTPFKEDDALLPVNSHGVMKVAIENYLRVHSHIMDLNYTIVRVSNPYGSTDLKERPQGVIDMALRRCIQKEEMEIWGDGQLVRDFLFIDDLTEALEAVIHNSDLHNEVINIGSGRGTSISEVIAAVQNVTGQELKLRILPGRPFDLQYNVLNIARAKAKLGWVPLVSLIEGIKKGYDRLKRKITA